MLSSWNPSPSELDSFAAEHVEYEVRMLLQQYEHLETRWAEVEAANRHDLGSDGQALLEAVVVHLRLLDDFLGDWKQARRPVSRWRHRRRRVFDSVYARHWDVRWKPTSVLSKKQRKRANAMVAHLSGKRPALGHWQPNELLDPVLKCCVLLDVFFDRVAKVSPKRFSAFRPAPERDAPQRVKDFLREKGH